MKKYNSKIFNSTKSPSYIQYFEVLATDTTGDVVVENEKSFCHNLLSNNKLWQNPEVDNNTVCDKDSGVRVVIKKIIHNEEQTELKKAFSLIVSGEFDPLEPFRLKLLKYLKNLNFDSLYVLEDDISRKISSRLYPDIYKVESFLRKYVIKFFALKLGPEWWKLTAGVDMQKKTNLRKNNETIFSEYIDNEVYLIDFGELGKLIHSQSSGNLSRDDIVNKIIDLEETVDSLVNLKSEIQTNYNKFFKKTFKENNFQQLWEELEKIRHKVAHNNLFILEDQEKGIELVSNLISIIKIANEEIDQMSFSDSDKRYIINSFFKFEKIKKDILLEELKRSTKWANESADGFVGLQSFIINILGSKGYDFQETRDIIQELEKEGVLEIYTHISDKVKHGEGVAAIRFKYLSDNLRV